MAICSVRLGFLVLISAGVCCSLPADCPPGWLAWHDSCYVLLPEKMDWWKAAKVCGRPGSNMVVINSQEEHDFIWQEMEVRMKDLGAKRLEREVWIGCQEENKKLSCLDEDSYPGYENWIAGEPNSNDSKCVRMAEKFDGGKWGDSLCKNQKFAACEMPVSRHRVYCLQADSTGRFTSQCLLNHEIKNLTTTGMSGCDKACWMEPRCHSFNLWVRDGKKICQLNGASSVEANLSDFKQVKNCHFFDM